MILLAKPYVICHMLQSINGDISGSYFLDDSTQKLSILYRNISNSFNVDAVAYGSTTAKEIFGCDESDSNSDDKESFQKEEIFIQKQYNDWIIVFDPLGTLNWTFDSLQSSRLQNKNLMIILSNKIHKNYLVNLRELGISYIVQDNERIDLKSLMNILYTKVEIEKILLQGGGILNGSFAKEGLIDGISLIISPCVEVSNNNVSCFSSLESNTSYTLNKFILSDTSALISSGIWLYYKKVD